MATWLNRHWGRTSVSTRNTRRNAHVPCRYVSSLVKHTGNLLFPRPRVMFFWTNVCGYLLVTQESFVALASLGIPKDIPLPPSLTKKVHISDCPYATLLQLTHSWPNHHLQNFSSRCHHQRCQGSNPFASLPLQEPSLGFCYSAFAIFLANIGLPNDCR